MRLNFVTPLARAAAGVLVGVLVGILIVGGVVLVVQIREATTSTNKTSKAVLDCTTPGGECFKRGRRATAKAVGDINRVIVLAASCADRPGDQTRRQIERCVLRQLAQP